jgi:uncharacterized membrane protein
MNLRNSNKKLSPTGRDVKHDQLAKEIQSYEGKFAEFVSNFAGSIYFVYLHALWFGFWIVANQGMLAPVITPFDPFPYGLLTMIVSLEAIFLSSFIMLNQNRQALVDEFRELEDEKEQRQEDIEQEELEEEVEDIQKDLDDIKNAVAFIQTKLVTVEKSNTAKKSIPSKSTS